MFHSAENERARDAQWGRTLLKRGNAAVEGRWDVVLREQWPPQRAL